MSSDAPIAPQSATLGEDNAAPLPAASPAPVALLSPTEVKEIVDRIRANQDYQAVLQLALHSLEKAIARNNDLQKVFQKEMDAKPKSNRNAHRLTLEVSTPKASNVKSARGNESDDEEADGEEDETSIGNILIKRCPRAEYFLDPYGKSPRVPEETGTRGIIYPAAPQRKKRFMAAEHAKLRQLVRQQNQQLLYSQLYTRMMDHSNSLTAQQLDQFETEKKHIATMSDFELEKDPSHIDWDAIQTAAFPNRTPNELETEWRLFCDPNYVRGPWSAEEDAALLAAAQRHSERHWDRIANDLGNKRLPVQYLARYQQSLRPQNVPDAREMTSRSYSVKTGAHKAKLTRGTAGFQLALDTTPKAPKTPKRAKGRTTQNPWPNDSTQDDDAALGNAPATMDEDSSQQEEEVIVTEKSGFKWTPEEDELLKEAVKKFGEKNWTAVASMLGSLRTGQQCLHRWQKTLNPNIRRGRWEQSEDNLLAMAVKAYGAGNWRLIQKHVPGRTDVQCRERWVNILDPSVRGSEGWTAAEDAHLLEIVASQPQGKWSSVAKFHNEGMLAQYNRLIAPPDASTSSAMEILDPTGDGTPPAPTETTTQLSTSMSRNLTSSSASGAAKNATPMRGKAPMPPPAPTKPPTRTDNQCWRRWKVLHKIVPKKPGGSAKSPKPSRTDFEALVARSEENSAEPTNNGDSSSASHHNQLGTHPDAPGQHTPRRAKKAASSSSSNHAPSPITSSPTSHSPSTSKARKGAKATAKKTQRKRKVPDWMRDDMSDDDDDIFGYDQEVAFPPPPKRPKPTATSQPTAKAELSISATPGAPTPKRSTRNAAKEAMSAMAAASAPIPLEAYEEDAPVGPTQSAPKKQASTRTKPTITAMIVSEPTQSDEISEQGASDGARVARKYLKVKFVKTKESS